MNFGVMFVNVGPLGEPDTFKLLAQTAEKAGFESLWTVEHSVVPVGYKSTYPYDPSGKMPLPDDMALLDPVLPLVYAAAVTEKIRLGTGILILPQRHPIYVAKEFATLDMLSKGRAILGIGVGWLEEEFRALGIEFADRASRTRESVDAIRTLWKPGAHSFEGKFFRWPSIESNPKPVQKPGVPIVVGGHTEIAARRAARYGDGFFPGSDLETVKSLLGILRDECAKVGRKPEEIEITSMAPAPDVDAIRRLADIGVHRVTLPPPGFDVGSIKSGLDQIEKNVIAKLR